MDLKDLFIVISTVLILIAPLPYIRDVIRLKTKPRVVSWFNWALLTAITGSASLSDHQYAAAIMSFSLALLCSAIFILGWRNGDRRLDKLDIFCQVGIFVALLLWWIFNSPAVAIIAVIVIDFIAYIPTLKHSWQKPREETWVLFLMTGLGAVLTILAAETVRVTSIANPLYLAIADLTTAGIIISRGRILK